MPRDARYVIALDGHKAKVVLPTAPAAESVRVDVSIAAHSRAKVGGIVLGATFAFAGALALSAFALDQAANGFSSYCSGWFCISDAAAGHIGASLLYGTSAFVGVAGLVTGLVLVATPSKTAVARVSSTSAVKWMPTVDATPHGASLGLVGAF